jgi:four helix bundle protein
MSNEYGGRNTQTFQKLPGFKNVIAWQKASDLAFLVENAVKDLGADWWKLAEQMRTAAWSVGGNIAEGYGRSSIGDYVRFCEIARGSLHELGSYIQDCERAQIITGATLSEIINRYSQVTYFLDRLMQGLQKQKAEGTWNRSHTIKESPPMYDAEMPSNWETWGTADGPSDFL